MATGGSVKSFRIIENVYRKHVTVCVEPNRRRAEAWIKERTTQEKDLTRCLGCTLYPNTSENDLLVWIQSKNDVTSLTHELLHCSTWILERAGVPMNVAADEALAYLQEYLLAQALQALGHRKLVGSLS